MFCTKCGLKNDDDSLFCAGCGAQLKRPQYAQNVNDANNVNSFSSANDTDTGQGDSSSDFFTQMNSPEEDKAENIIEENIQTVQKNVTQMENEDVPYSFVSRFEEPAVDSVQETAQNEPVQNFIQQQNYSQPQGFEQVQGYDRSQNYEQPQSYGQPQSYEPSQDFEQPQGYEQSQDFGYSQNFTQTDNQQYNGSQFNPQQANVQQFSGQYQGQQPNGLQPDMPQGMGVQPQFAGNMNGAQGYQNNGIQKNKFSVKRFIFSAIVIIASIAACVGIALDFVGLKTTVTDGSDKETDTSYTKGYEIIKDRIDMDDMDEESSGLVDSVRLFRVMVIAFEGAMIFFAIIDFILLVAVRRRGAYVFTLLFSLIKAGLGGFVLYLWCFDILDKLRALYTEWYSSYFFSFGDYEIKLSAVLGIGSILAVGLQILILICSIILLTCKNRKKLV